MYRVKILNSNGRYMYTPWMKTLKEASARVFSLGIEGIYLEVDIEQTKTEYENGYKAGYKIGYNDGLLKSHVKTIEGVCKDCIWLQEYKGEYICTMPRDSASGMPWTRPLTEPNKWCSEFLRRET